MLSTMSTQILVRNWPVKYKNYLKHLNHTSINVNVIMDCKTLLINELKDAFFLLKINKSSDVDDVSFNIIKKCFGVLSEPLIYQLQLYLGKG